jgi:transcriptional regulator with XRE-family HTH domain
VGGCEYYVFHMAANRIRELREQHRYTQDALAFRCRVSTRSAIAWERGEKRPRARNQRRLAKVLGVSVEELQLGATD